MSRWAPRWLLCALLWLPSCLFGDSQCVTKTGNPSSDGDCPTSPDVLGDNPVLREIAIQCGIDVDCEGGGIAEGNAAISGIASVDGFFQTVIGYRGRANALEATLSAELAALRAVFEIDPSADLTAELDAQLQQHLDGELSLVLEPPRCHVDTAAVLELTARCDASVEGGSAVVECRGRCELPEGVQADCGIDGRAVCTFASSSAACDGECTGACNTELTEPTRCDGDCYGTCDGTCARMSGTDAGGCAGACDGMCEGRCETDLVGVRCDGECNGQCAVEDDGTCEGALRVECVATGDAAVACEGRCDGDVEPPMAVAECQASARAEAGMHAQCSPARVSLDYRLRPDLDAADAARFRAAMASLEARLPALLTGLASAEVVLDVGSALVSDAAGTLDGAIDAAAQSAAEGNLQVLFGVECAVAELGSVPGLVSSATSPLSATVAQTSELAVMLTTR